jgi:hypothetical protein
VEIFVHRSTGAEPELIEVDESVVVGEGLALTEDDGVWREDDDVEVDRTLTLHEADIADRRHVHVHKCRKVNVQVRFNDEEKDHAFSPGTTVHHVFEWGTGPHGFALTEVDRAEHTLQVCDTDTRPEPRDHLGSFTSPDSCSVCFSIVPKHRFEG